MASDAFRLHESRFQKDTANQAYRTRQILYISVPMKYDADVVNFTRKSGLIDAKSSSRCWTICGPCGSTLLVRFGSAGFLGLFCYSRTPLITVVDMTRSSRIRCWASWALVYGIPDSDWRSCRVNRHWSMPRTSHPGPIDQTEQQHAV